MTKEEFLAGRKFKLDPEDIAASFYLNDDSIYQRLCGPDKRVASFWHCKDDSFEVYSLLFGSKTLFFKDLELVQEVEP